jgi:hypothetical protein
MNLLTNKDKMSKAISLIGKHLKIIFDQFIKFPLYILTHPIDGFYEMKEGKQGLYRVATIYLLIHAVLGIVEFAYTGFLFNNINPNRFSMFRAIMIALLPFIIFMVANWSITSLMDGKGKFKEIYMTVGYAFFPYVWLRIFSLFTSNFFTMDEGFFYYGTVAFGLGLTFFMIFMGIRSIHEYTLFRTVTTVFLTFVSMSVIVFLGLLTLNLAQQIVLFIQTIVKELLLRL